MCIRDRPHTLHHSASPHSPGFCPPYGREHTPSSPCLQTPFFPQTHPAEYSLPPEKIPCWDVYKRQVSAITGIADPVRHNAVTNPKITFFNFLLSIHLTSCLFFVILTTRVICSKPTTSVIIAINEQIWKNVQNYPANFINASKSTLDLRCLFFYAKSRTCSFIVCI